MRDLPDRRQVRPRLTVTARQLGQDVLEPLGTLIDAAADRLSPHDADIVAAFLAGALPEDPGAAS